MAKIIKKYMRIMTCFLLIFVFIASSSYAVAKVIRNGNSKEPLMSLTFDDGGSPENVRSVLNTLDKYNVHVTFFLVGKFIDQNPELIKEIISRGHEVGNHSYSHPELTKLSYNGIKNELLKTQISFKKATGVDMKPYVRPPYGSKNSSVIKVISDMGYTHVVLWNVDTNDWKGKSPKELTNHVLSNAGNGNIVLMHTTKSSNSYKALSSMIEGLQKKGYKLVTISELLNETSNTEISKETIVNVPKDKVETISKDESISQVEFLNNLIYTKTGMFFSTIEEIKFNSSKLGISTDNLDISYDKSFSKDEMIAFIKKAYPEKIDIESKLKSIDFKKSNLSKIVEILQSL